MTRPKRFEVKPKKRNYFPGLIVSLFFLLFGLAGFVVGVPTTTANILCGLFISAIGVVGLFMTIKLLQRPISIVLDESGLQQIMVLGNTTIPWEDIESIGTTRVQANKMIGIRLKKYDKYINNISPELAAFMNRSLPFIRIAAVGASFLDVSITHQLWSALEGRESPSKSLKKLGKAGSLAELMLLTRQTLGYDILFNWAELDRPASEFIQLLESYRSAFGKDFHALSSGQAHRDYPNVIAGSDGKWYPAPGYKWVDVKKDLRVVWAPSQIHRDYPNVVAAQKEGNWLATPGYKWVNPTGQGDLRVVWAPGQIHRDYPNVLAGEDGKWYPAPGYKWVDVKKDLRVIWQPKLIHRDYPNVIAGEQEGVWSPAGGYRWVNPNNSDDFRVDWCPGCPHEHYPNVVSGEDGKWYPAPGYKWVDVKKDLQVVWAPGQLHRDNPKLFAAEKEETWYAAPGYKWVNPNKDLQIAWEPGQIHRDQPHLVSGQKEGEWRSATENAHASSSAQAEKVITSCPVCSQKLRAPSDRGTLTLSCPKCKHGWQWNPSKGRS